MRRLKTLIRVFIVRAFKKVHFLTLRPTLLSEGAAVTACLSFRYHVNMINLQSNLYKTRQCNDQQQCLRVSTYETPLPSGICIIPLSGDLYVRWYFYHKRECHFLA